MVLTVGEQYFGFLKSNWNLGIWSYGKFPLDYESNGISFGS